MKYGFLAVALMLCIGTISSACDYGNVGAQDVGDVCGNYVQQVQAVSYVPQSIQSVRTFVPQRQVVVQQQNVDYLAVAPAQQIVQSVRSYQRPLIAAQNVYSAPLRVQNVNYGVRSQNVLLSNRGYGGVGSLAISTPRTFVGVQAVRPFNTFGVRTFAAPPVRVQSVGVLAGGGLGGVTVQQTSGAGGFGSLGVGGRGGLFRGRSAQPQNLSIVNQGNLTIQNRRGGILGGILGRR